MNTTTITIGDRECILEQPRPLFSELNDVQIAELNVLLDRQLAMLTPEQVEEIKRVGAAYAQYLDNS